MVAPGVPTRGPGGQAVFDHQPYRQIHHAVGILTTRRRQSREVGAKVLAALRTGGLRIGDHESPRTPQVEIPQVVQCPLELFVPIGLVTTMRTRLAWVDAPGRDDFWRWQVGNRRDPFRGIGSIRTRPEQGCVLRARMFGPPLYDKGPLVAISKPGEDAIVSNFDAVCPVIRKIIEAFSSPQMM